MFNFCPTEARGVFDIVCNTSGDLAGSLTRLHTGEYVVSSPCVSCTVRTWDDAVFFAERFI